MIKIDFSRVYLNQTKAQRKKKKSNRNKVQTKTNETRFEKDQSTLENKLTQASILWKTIFFQETFEWYVEADWKKITTNPEG